MPDITEQPDRYEAEARRGDERPLAQQIGWMVALWGGGVLSVGVVAYAIRWWLGL